LALFKRGFVAIATRNPNFSDGLVNVLKGLSNLVQEVLGRAWGDAAFQLSNLQLKSDQ
jgi:hypothetical protein